MSQGGVKELVEAIAKALVDNPEQVQVRAVEGEQVTVLELRVDPNDLGKVIGRQGRTAKSIRTILGAAGMKIKKRLTLEILE
ncbi:MAG TPA: KH domain-containing protein [Candidatus Dormibacteraeota bacterium]|nr:KH domain-containing protein [Candidatus Dormibacteraeota bacterium]